MNDLKRHIRDIPGFPKPGIIFRDITPLLADAAAFRSVVDQIAERYHGRVDMVLGIESRGFIIGAALAYKLNKGVILVRKRGKLPYKVHSTTYDLEYGTDTLEIHQDAIDKGQRVVIADDLLATGGTVRAVVDVVRRMGGDVLECTFLTELTFLGGRQKLSDVPVYSLIQF